ncbi:DNA-3-methyladenine glycosylase, partial [Dufourea novaeangliae]
RFVSCASSMKRTRASSQVTSTKEEIRDDSSKNETQKKSEDNEYDLMVDTKNLQNQILNNVSESASKSVGIMKSSNEVLLEDVTSSEPKQKSKLNLRSLRDRNKKNSEELKSNPILPKNKSRAVVDLKMMTEELKQLEDPPSTDWEKEISSNRLPFSFFDCPCEELAQSLLGKILVRCLENGTILKGRIVETEGYLGVIDKASHTYKNKITPRNIPMYMLPGTIYVYMTYGMYHCLNVSSQESGACVQIKAVEPILGLNYMELLRNMQYEKNGKEKRIMKDIEHIKQYELCNSPSKICAAFDIDEDSFNEKKIYKCNDLWIEFDPYIKFTTIVAAQHNNDTEHSPQKLWRYYVLGSKGCAVLIRAIEPFEGIECMASQRTSKGTSSAPKKSLRNLKTHELCNGPSKLCMAFQLHKKHSKYSMCAWRGLWIESDNMNEEIKIVTCPRIGIDGYGEEWSNKPLRYYIHGNKAVSKRNKGAELSLGLN